MIAEAATGSPAFGCPAAGSERGLATSLQWALLMPLLLGILVAICDAATWWHARGVVQQATIAAAQSASYWQDPGTARRTAQIALRSTAASPPEVHLVRRPDEVRVTVATDIRLITGTRHLAHSAAAPTERLDP